MKVRATQMGYIDLIRRREGDVFTIPDEPRRKLRDKPELEEEEVINGRTGEVRKIVKRRYAADGPLMHSIADAAGTVPVAFSATWMTPVDIATPEKITTGAEHLKKHHDEVLASKAPASARAGTGNADVI